MKFRVQSIEDTPFTLAIEYSNNLAIYVGESEPGTAKDSCGWRIKKITYSGTNATDVKWAGGSRLFDNIWDYRTTYTYS